ncbi:hypothetical protein HYS91_02545 [Candidatus Daviesbacteria bacterium]|nr:hypothetical protein [Candidatus Daviesbacteria bacterium]
MKITVTKQPETKITQPIEPSGSVKIAGEKVSIGTQTVSSKPGSSPKAILKGLKEASKKAIFPPPALAINE